MSNDPKPALVTGKADRKPKEGKKVLDEISVRPVADGGFIVKNRYREGDKESYMSNYAPTEHVFETADAAIEHVGSALGAAKESAASGGKAEKSEKGGYVQGRAEREK